jgi:hypothetical protein
MADLVTAVLVSSKPSNGSPFQDSITLVGPTAYETGGVAGLRGLVQGLTDDGRVPYRVSSLTPQGYGLWYIPATDKLQFFYGNFDASDGPLIEVPATTALNGITFHLWVDSE